MKKKLLHLLFLLFCSFLATFIVVVVDSQTPLISDSFLPVRIPIYVLLLSLFLLFLVRSISLSSFVSRSWMPLDSYCLSLSVSFLAIAILYLDKSGLIKTDDRNIIFLVAAWGFAVCLFYYLIRLLISFWLFRRRKNCIDQPRTAMSLYDLFICPIKNVPDDLFLTNDPSTNDCFRRDKLKREIVKEIDNNLDAKRLVIGVKGSWGIGKTSFIKSTFADLKGHPSLILIDDFSIWPYTDESSLLSGMINAIVEKIDFGLPELILKGFVETYVDSFLQANQSSFVKGAVHFASLCSPDSSHELVVMLNSYLKKNKKRVVFLLDDIDRAPNGQIRFVYQCIASLNIFENVTFLLAYDQAVVEKAFEEKLQINYAFLNKIIDVSFSLEKPEDYVVADVYLKCLIKLPFLAGKLDNPKAADRLAKDCVKYLETPREFCLLVNKLCTERTMADSLDVYDWIYLDIISIVYPDLYLDISSRPFLYISWRGNLVSDSSKRYDLSGVGDLQKMRSEILQEKDGFYQDLICHLLPYFDPDVTSDKVTSSLSKIGRAGFTPHLSDGRFFDLYFHHDENQYLLCRREVFKCDEEYHYYHESSLTTFVTENLDLIFSKYPDCFYDIIGDSFSSFFHEDFRIEAGLWVLRKILRSSFDKSWEDEKEKSLATGAVKECLISLKCYSDCQRFLDFEVQNAEYFFANIYEYSLFGVQHSAFSQQIQNYCQSLVSTFMKRASSSNFIFLDCKNLSPDAFGSFMSFPPNLYGPLPQQVSSGNVHRFLRCFMSPNFVSHDGYIISLDGLPKGYSILLVDQCLKAYQGPFTEERAFVEKLFEAAKKDPNLRASLLFAHPIDINNL